MTRSGAALKVPTQITQRSLAATERGTIHEIHETTLRPFRVSWCDFADRPLYEVILPQERRSPSLRLLAIPPPTFVGTTAIPLEQLINALVDRRMPIVKLGPSGYPQITQITPKGT